MNKQFPKRNDHRTFSKDDDVTKSSLLLEETFLDGFQKNK